MSPGVLGPSQSTPSDIIPVPVVLRVGRKNDPVCLNPHRVLPVLQAEYTAARMGVTAPAGEELDTGVDGMSPPSEPSSLPLPSSLYRVI